MFEHYGNLYRGGVELIDLSGIDIISYSVRGELPMQICLCITLMYFF